MNCHKCGLTYVKDSNHESDCIINWEERCPYGCQTHGFTAEQLKNHRHEKFLSHLDILYSILLDVGLTKSMNIDYGSESNLEIQILNELKPEIVRYKSLFDHATYAKRKISIKLKERKVHMKEFEQIINEMSSISYAGHLIWIISKNPNRSDNFQSPIFFTGKYGYKLKLELQQNNPEASSSLLLRFLEGPCDPILPNSFETHISVKYTMSDSQEFEFKEKVDLTLKYDKVAWETKIQYGTVEHIDFSIDCSEFDFSSID